MNTPPVSRLRLRLICCGLFFSVGQLLLVTCLGTRCRTDLGSLVRHSVALLTRAGMQQEDSMEPGRQVALIPGTSIHGQMLRQRVEAAARLYHAGIVSHLILSGDGRSLSYHEPHAMRRMLLALRVPEHAMLEDAGGLSTYDSIARAGRIAAGRRLVIVTQAWHCPRALLLARGLGINAIACALPSQPSQALQEREEKATLRAVLDLAGLRRATEWAESFLTARSAAPRHDHACVLK